MAPGALNLGYQRQNTGAYLNPRAYLSLGPSFMTEPFEAKLNSILTRLRIWMRRASKRRLRTIREMNRMWNATLPADEQWNRVKLGRNNLNRGGPYAAVGGIGGSLDFGVADEQCFVWIAYRGKRFVDLARGNPHPQRQLNKDV